MARTRKTTLSARGVLYWHWYHATLIHLPGSSGVIWRKAMIRRCKPYSQQEVRLRLLKRVQGQLPRELIVRARSGYMGFTEWERLVNKYEKEINTLHAIECPNCPWNGRTIFPRKRRKA